MKKSEEIQALKSLKGDTYFAIFFGEDIDQMCENIRNDHPIEFNCKFAEKFNEAREELHSQHMNHKEEIKQFVRDILDDCFGCPSSEVYEILVKKVGRMFIINYKREKDYTLTDDEIDFLIHKVNELS